VIAAMWDDLVLDASSSVNTTAGGDSFTIEWRNAVFYESVERIDAEITLYEDGQIVITYRNLDPGSDRELGSSASVGIENADGTIGIQYGYSSPFLSNDTAIRFFPPAD
jgi:hypothetical protein